MIGRIRGEVIDVEPQSIVVDVQGVGYLLNVALGGVYAVGDQVDVFVQTHVREDAFMLYGFRTKQEREIFNHLTSVPNIGPSKAIAIVGTPIDELVQLVVSGDIKQMTKLPGVGKKTAERMVVDLQDKFRSIGVDILSTPPVASTGDSPLMSDLLSALKNLGFRPGAAEQAAKRAVDDLAGEQDLDGLIRQALNYLRS
ncbi:MAG: Holliday junction branch migration protein RuvA [Myxococcota bacterium]|nr:Holliday junction branch migration protein RuvA [Myxococcota bacterium]